MQWEGSIPPLAVRIVMWMHELHHLLFCKLLRVKSRLVTANNIPVCVEYLENVPLWKDYLIASAPLLNPMMILLDLLAHREIDLEAVGKRISFY